MSTATLRLHYRAIHQKVSSVNFIRIPWKVVYFLALAVSVFLLIFYIFQVNSLTQGAFIIKSYNKQISSLLSENKVWETIFAESGFLGNVQEHAKQLGFQKTAQVTYIQILPNSLAKANNASQVK